MPPVEEEPRRSAISVRRFRESDTDAVVSITQHSPEAAGWTRTGYLSFLQQPGAFALVAEEQGRVVGFLVSRVVGQQAEVLNLAVHPENRRSGCATLLLVAALEEFRSRGAESVYLEVRQSNTAAIAFYTKHGFEITGSRRVYYSDPLEDAVTMRKPLA